jgi:hypothetical protein
VYTRSIRVLVQALPSLTRRTIPKQRNSRHPFHQALATSVLQAIQSAGTSLMARVGVAVCSHTSCVSAQSLIHRVWAGGRVRQRRASLNLATSRAVR